MDDKRICVISKPANFLFHVFISKEKHALDN